MKNAPVSAYTRDSAQIIGKVKRLRDLGLRIEMDDFGTGYSSLSMISNLPIDALKPGMTFLAAAYALKGSSTNLALTPISDPVCEITELLRAHAKTDYTPPRGDDPKEPGRAQANLRELKSARGTKSITCQKCGDSQKTRVTALF